MNYYNNPYIANDFPYQQAPLSSPLVSSVPSPQSLQSPKPRPYSNIVWAQGIEAARSYVVAPGTTIIMLDSDDAETLYIKSCDNTGRPSLRVCDYKDREIPKSSAVVAPSNQDYVLKKDFEKFRDEVKNYLNNREVKKNEPIIPANDEPIPYGIRERS